MNHPRIPAALRLLRNQPHLTAWAVARRLNMDRAAARVMLLEAEHAGLLSVTLGTVDAEHGTQAKRYAPAVPVLTPMQRRVLSAVVLCPGIHSTRAAALAACPRPTAARALLDLERLGLIVSRLEMQSIQGRHRQPRRVRTCTPAPWVLT